MAAVPPVLYIYSYLRLIRRVISVFDMAASLTFVSDVILVGKKTRTPTDYTVLHRSATGAHDASLTPKVDATRPGPVVAGESVVQLTGFLRNRASSLAAARRTCASRRAPNRPSSSKR